MGYLGKITFKLQITIVECNIQIGVAPSHKNSPNDLCYPHLNFREPSMSPPPPICGPNDLTSLITVTAPRLSPFYAEVFWNIHLYQRCGIFT